MKYVVAVAVAKIVLILFKLRVISDSTADHLIDEITIRSLQHEMEEKKLGDKDGEETNIQS